MKSDKGHSLVQTSMGLRCISAFGIGCVCLLASCGGAGSTAQKTEAPAKVQNAVKESELATITLTSEAEKRLGIELATVESKRIQRTRSFGGEVVVPSEREIIVTAPMAGRLAAPEASAVPAVGDAVKKGKGVFRLYPIPSPQEVLDARQMLEQAQIRFDTAQQRAKRAEQLLKDRAGSIRGNEEAKAEAASATVALNSARSRVEMLSKGSDAANVALTPVLITAPLAGIVSEVHARDGQTVSAGTPLFRVQNADTVWIRVPVYVGEIETLDARSSVQVFAFSDVPGKAGRTARPIAAPPSANANAASVDLYYELSNADGRLRPAQRVEASLPLHDSEQALTVPWAAVLHDAFGGTWVYVKFADHVYSRRKVEVRYVSGGLAVLARGPASGTKVVAAGAAELFGTEFATGK
jgi:RND family efflux transporter MFP subunit